MVSIDKCHLVSVTADCLHYLMSISDSSEARASGIVHYEASFIMRLEDLSNAKYQGEQEFCPTSPHRLRRRMEVLAADLQSSIAAI